LVTASVATDTTTKGTIDETTLADYSYNTDKPTLVNNNEILKTIQAQ
jgi:hypothetical protein